MLDDGEELYGGYKLDDFPPCKSGHIEQLVADKQEESHSLEYKSARVLQEDPVKLCREVCSFLNSEGGVIIVGVEEERRSGDKGYRKPSRIEGTTEERSLQWLQDILLSGLLPAVPFENFRMHKFPDPNQSEDRHGYVIFVPRSYTAPHQVRKRAIYYRRGSAGCVPMLDYEIMDMLGRRQRPQVTIEPYDHTVFTKGAAPNTDYTGHMTLWFTVGNCGKAPARSISVRIHGVEQPRPVSPREGAQWRHVPAGPQGEWYCAWEPDFPLLPKAAERLSIGYHVNVPETERDVNSQMPFPVVRRQVNIVGEAYAEGQDPMPFGLYLRAQWHMGEYVADDETTARGIIPRGELSGLQTGVIEEWDFFEETPPSGED